MSLAYSDVQRYVKLRLGEGFVRVELKDDAIDLAVDEAVKVYGRHIPLYRFVKINLIDANQPSTEQPTGHAYHLSKDVIGVYRVDFVLATASLATIEDIFHQRYWSPIHAMDEYARYMHYIDTLKRVINIEPEFFFDGSDKNDPKLWVYAPRQANFLLACAMCCVRRELHQIPLLHEDWVERYALMQCKETIARVRGKFQAIPSPSGSQQLDSATLLAESAAERQALMLEIRGYQVLPPPIFG